MEWMSSEKGSRCLNRTTAFAVAFGAASLLIAPASAADYATNIWTADGGGSWQEAANWSDSSLVSAACYVDLSAAPDGAVITSTGKSPTIWGVIATNDSSTVKTITLKRSENNTSTLFVLAGPSSSFKATDFRLKNVRLVIENPCTWATGNSDNIRIQSGANGTLVLKGASSFVQQWNEGGNVNIRVEGTENVLEIASKLAAERCNVTCAKTCGFRLAADAVINCLSVAAETCDVWLNGCELRLGTLTTASALKYDVFRDAGFVSAINGVKVAVEAGQTGAVAYCGREGQLTLAASAVTAATTLESEGHGEIALGGSAAVGTIRSGSVGLTGAISVPANATLTVNGTGATTSTVYAAKLTGAGGFVKRGADYTLTLQGPNDYQGATRVEEGALVVSRAYPAASGLVADWAFDDAADIGHDSSGNGITLNLYNKAGLSIVDDAERGKVAHFDSSQKAYMAASLANHETFPAGNAAYTLSCWVKAPAGNGDMGLISYWGNTASLQGAISAFSWKNGFYFENRGNGKQAIKWVNWEGGTPYNMHDGKWHHVVQTYDNGVRKAYIDTVKRIDDTTGPLAVTRSTIYIGWGGLGGNYNYLEGWLDDFRVYDYALTAAEVAEEFKYGTRIVRAAANRLSTQCAPTPVARYTFEDAENIGKDSVGGADMTETSGTVTTVYDAERGGRVLDLSDSALGYLALANAPDAFPSGDHNITISCWVRPYDGFKVNETAVFHYGASESYAYNTGLALTYHTKNNLFTLCLDGKAGASFDVETAVRNTANCTRKWHHVACTVNVGSDFQKLYIDGRGVSTAWFGNAWSLEKALFRLGNLPGKTSGFRGWIDDVRVYDKTLYQEDVNRIIAEETAKAGVLPQKTDLSVAAGASVTLRSVSETIGALSGSGTVRLADQAVLEVTAPSVFDGTLDAAKGWVRIGEGGSLRRSDGTSLAGDITLAEGLTVKVDSTASNLPIVKTTGTVTLPATGTVTLSEGADVPPRGKYVVVEAGQLVAPDGVAGWTVGGELADRKCKLLLDGNKVVLKVCGGFHLIVR